MNGPRDLPAVDRLLSDPRLQAPIAAHGRALVLAAAREVLEELRAALRAGRAVPDAADPAAAVAGRVRDWVAPPLRPLFNLTGILLHTNLGRAALSAAAIAAMTEAAAAVNLEYDLETGRRGQRDDHLSGWLCRLTGAEAALAVNNNAAAVMLVLNSLALRREVPVSRGELVEIGGAFRLPDIMARAGCRLVEVGTTNRTHEADYAAAIGPRTGLLLQVHRSNFAITGFTHEVPLARLAALAHDAGLPLAVDLGSGHLVDPAGYGLPPEPTVQAVLAAGADLVTFSGDKMLGGPQAGLIVGRAALVARLRRNPMLRAMRLDKLRIAALAATLPAHADPGALAAQLPFYRALARPLAEIEALAADLRGPLQAALGAAWQVQVAAGSCEVGSGAAPTATLPSAVLRIAPAGRRPGKGRGGTGAAALAARLRRLDRPVVGRVRDGAVELDLRALEDPQALLAAFAGLPPDGPAPAEAGRA